MLKKISFSILAALVLCASAEATVTVKTAEDSKGPIKLMNAVNNGPIVSDRGGQFRDNFEAYRDARIPYARTHDSSFCNNYGGEHTVDISAIFPDFSKDVDDPASYDFVMTDYYLDIMRKAGTEPFFRLGQKIEHNKKKYDIYPPADYKKWAEICEHIIRHYNEGWADGFNWNIQYWEIWNEADGNKNNWDTPRATCWAGPKEEFFKFFATAVKHLKDCFPNLKIGGPAISSDFNWAEELLQYLAARKIGLDFFSFHCYGDNPEKMVIYSNRAREILDRNGFKDTETILNEWNYIKDWTDDFLYSMRQVNGLKGAAFVAAVFCALQDQPLDMLMYYDARIGTVFNGLFDPLDLSPTESYYVFYAWSKMLDLGAQLGVDVEEDDIYAVAATDGGKKALFISRYNEDDNVVTTKYVEINLGDKNCTHAIGHLTDSSHKYTEVPVHVSDGIAKVKLEPNAYIMIEY